MRIEQDKRLHLAFGLAAALGAVAVLLIGRHVGAGAALAFASTTVGMAYERVQRIRKSGEPSKLDAAFTAAPGFVAWAVLELLALWRGSPLL
jgi:uncharacterized membrane protein YjjB (DUF3815 family)